MHIQKRATLHRRELVEELVVGALVHLTQVQKRLATTKLAQFKDLRQVGFAVTASVLNKHTRQC